MAKTPIQEPQAAPTQTVSQTGAPQTPVQIENTQYNVPVKGVRSKIGLAMSITTFLLWIVGFVMFSLLSALTSEFFQTTEQEGIVLVQELLFSLSALIVIAPLLVFTKKRVDTIIHENPAAIEDIFFKRTVRFNLFFFLVVGVCAAIFTLYDLLSLVILQTQETTYQEALTGLYIAAIAAGHAYFHWSYQRQTQR